MIMRLVAACSVLIWSGFVYASEPAREFVFGVEPTHGSRAAAHDWTPVLDAVQRKTGVRLRFATARNVPVFSERVEQHAFDFAVVNPADYLNHEDEEGYRAIVRARDVRLKGILVVRKDSPVERLDQLRMQRVALPSGTFAGDRVPMAALREQGVEIVRDESATAETVYRNVAEGRVVAGGGTPRTLNAIAPELRSRLRILWTSEGYTAHAIVAHARVPQDVIDAVQRALIEMSDDAEGRVVLAPIAPSGLDYGRDADWDDARELDL